MRKPFYRKALECWYVKDDRDRFIKLDRNKKKAFAMWQAMLAASNLNTGKVTFTAIAEAFFAEHESIITESQFNRIRYFAEEFTKWFGITRKADELSPGLVRNWLKLPKLGRLKKDGNRGDSKVWSVARQRDAGLSLKRIVRWAHKMGHVKADYLHALKLEQPRPREQLIDRESHKALIENARESRNRSFALYLIASHCGARPQQIRDLEAKHISKDGCFMVFKEHKTAAKTGKPLIVFASPCMQTLLRILMQTRPKGKLFLTDEGKPWLKDTVCRRMRRMRESLGLNARTIAYSYRHTFATDSLLAGNDIATVAALLGHTDVGMVAKVYGHLDQHKQHLLEAARKTAEVRHKFA